MAAYRPEMWGRTKVKQAFSGHIHHTKADEDMGSRWETPPHRRPSRRLRLHQYGLLRWP